MLRFLTGLFLLLVTTSCASNLKSTAKEGADLSKDLTYYVAWQSEDNSGVNEEVCAQLNLWGRKATTGTREEMPADTDILVTYMDHWMWDITMYLLSMDMTFIDTRTEEELASGTSMATSLVRKSQEWHTNALLTDIFAKTNPEDAHPDGAD